MGARGGLGHGEVFGGDPGADAVGGGGQVVQGRQHRLVVGPGTGEDLGVRADKRTSAACRSPSKLVSEPCSARLRSHIPRT